MFLTRDDFHLSQEMIEIFEDVGSFADIQPKVALNYAKNIFEDFEKMSEDDRQRVIEMILEDMSEHYYTIS